MTAISHRDRAGAAIDAGRLAARHNAARRLKQSVDGEAILTEVKCWAVNIGIESNVAIRLVNGVRDVEQAAAAANRTRDAKTARAAREARDAPEVPAARDAGSTQAAWKFLIASITFAANSGWRERAAQPSWNVEVGWDGWYSVAGAWDLSFVSTIAIGAASQGDETTLQKWLPLLKAFEAGAYALWIGATTIYVAVIPSTVKTDNQQRLHCEDGPAFVWLDDIRDYYWHGVRVPSEWITNRKYGLTAKGALMQKNIERRRAACDMLGWDAILRSLDAVSIDRDRDPQIGELLEVKLPGEGDDVINARFLRVRCGTGRMFAVCVPPYISSALDAQAWMMGVPLAHFKRPEVRT